MLRKLTSFFRNDGSRERPFSLTQDEPLAPTQAVSTQLTQVTQSQPMSQSIDTQTLMAPSQISPAQMMLTDEEHDECVALEALAHPASDNAPIPPAAPQTAADNATVENDVGDSAKRKRRTQEQIAKERLELDSVSQLKQLEPETWARQEAEMAAMIATLKEQITTLQAPPDWVNCNGCNYFGCVESVNIIDMKNVNPAAVTKWCRNHDLTWNPARCQHGDCYVPFHPDTHKCLAPGCRLVNAEPTGPIHPSRTHHLAKPITDRIMFIFLWSLGLQHNHMHEHFKVANVDTLSKFRAQHEDIMAAAHALETADARGKVRFAQFDEFQFGVAKNGIGSAVSIAGPMWFQSCAVTDRKPGPGVKTKVLAYYVRFVFDRSDSLQDWIIDLCTDDSDISTDCWSAYNKLSENALKQGKTIRAIGVNHSLTFTNRDNNHTNNVEGMHSHTKFFLRKFLRLGQDRLERINRVLAAAVVSNPAQYASALARVFAAYRRVAQLGVPALNIVFDAHTNPFVGPYRVINPHPERKTFVTADGTELQFKTTKRTRDDTKREFEEVYAAHHASRPANQPAALFSKAQTDEAKAEKRLRKEELKVVKLQNQRQRKDEDLYASEKRVARFKQQIADAQAAQNTNRALF